MSSSWISAGWKPSFPPGEQWDAGSAEVRFAVQLIDRSFACRVTLAALRDHYGADEQDALDVFRRNRARFENRVKRKMRAGQYQPDRSILIDSSDLEVRQ